MLTQREWEHEKGCAMTEQKGAKAMTPQRRQVSRYPNIKRILENVPRRALVVMNIQDAADGTLRLELHIRDTSRNRVLWAVKWRYDFDRAMHDLDCLIAKTEKGARQ